MSPLLLVIDGYIYALTRLDVPLPGWSLEKLVDGSSVASYECHTGTKWGADCSCPSFTLRPSRGPCKHLLALSDVGLLQLEKLPVGRSR